MKDMDKIYDFLRYSEGLKLGLRHTWLSNGRQESTSDHTWRMALMAMILAPRTKIELDMERVLKMIIVHDLVEIDAVDIPSFLHMNDGKLANQKRVEEDKAIRKIRGMLADDSGKEIESLWREYEAKETNEALFAGYMDKMEGRTQKILQGKDRIVPAEIELNQIRKFSNLIESLANGDEFLEKFHEYVKVKRDKTFGVRE